MSVHVAKTEKIVPIQILAIKRNRDSKTITEISAEA